MLAWFLLGHWRIVGLLLLLCYPVCGLKCIPLVHMLLGFFFQAAPPAYCVCVHVFVVGLDFNHSGPCHEYCSGLLLG